MVRLWPRVTGVLTLVVGEVLGVRDTGIELAPRRLGQSIALRAVCAAVASDRGSLVRCVGSLV